MIDFKALAAPFAPEEIEWRLGSVSKAQKRGMALAYLTARPVMDRLDAVCGHAGWQCRYSHVGPTTVCEIGINVGPAGDGIWLWKADGAGQSDIEAEKGSLSDAFKRAAVRWEIGRYLYHLDSPWVEVEEIGQTGKYRIVKGAYRELDMILRRATQALLAASPKAPDGLAEAKDDIARMQNAGTQPISEIKSAGRMAAEKYVSDSMQLFRAPGFNVGEWYASPATPKGTKTHREKVAELAEKHPDLHESLEAAADALRSPL